MLSNEIWEIIDTRTGKRCTINVYPSKESAKAQIRAWRQRDKEGGRPDVHDLMPYMDCQIARRSKP